MLVRLHTCLVDRPIASLAFHAQGDFLAVASGHKVLPRFLHVVCIFLNEHGLRLF